MTGTQAERKALDVLARIRSDFKEKFGIPRQSGLVPQTRAAIVFEHAYRNPDALRGIEGFSHLWLIWEFSACGQKGWSPTVRPPRLGGNKRMGVFATRSPFRPNGLGLSCVTLEEVRLNTEEGPVLIVGGADLMDGSPIYDIKPYLPLSDCRAQASSGFAGDRTDGALRVVVPKELEERIDGEKRQALYGVLAQDPRPSYQSDPSRVYGVSFAGLNVRFTVAGSVLTVCDVQRRDVDG
ncbi:MAG TPA: tRNA (N6-threonylcarbamoyladenosine(37)-N6)-methyltransferase TrmO [Candidatus Ventricola intestinavium]|nr:tRNA (N6-threonylcarbamoyladenosine(37)-N6)-methyltransferase TrmO [Candidatus Ventricola intestinavium]